jgi:hypothetical protein
MALQELGQDKMPMKYAVWPENFDKEIQLNLQCRGSTSLWLVDPPVKG